MNPQKKIKLDPEIMEYPKYDDYEVLGQIGEGSFGGVYKAQVIADPTKCVAIKQMLRSSKGNHQAMLREVFVLQKIQHENIVTLYGVQRKAYLKGNSHRLPSMILEYCDHDLEKIISNTHVKFRLGEIKQIMKQLFTGLCHLHKHSVMHRDLKPANILMTSEGALKLADFGLARHTIDQSSGIKQYCFTPRLATLVYRAPELLLGNRQYGPPVDMWAAGCILVEMWARVPLFPGKTEQEQLTQILDMIGPITPEIRRKIENTKLLDSIVWPKNRRRQVVQFVGPVVTCETAFDLVDQLLVLDPDERLYASEVLEHDFFNTEPQSCNLIRLLSEYNRTEFHFFENKSKPNTTCVGDVNGA